jgi:hypothetical protein
MDVTVKSQGTSKQGNPNFIYHPHIKAGLVQAQPGGSVRVCIIKLVFPWGWREPK